jgi:hypothetical protein
VHAVDRPTINGNRDAKPSAGFQARSERCPLAAWHRDPDLPAPQVDGRGGSTRPPIFSTPIIEPTLHLGPSRSTAKACRRRATVFNHAANVPFETSAPKPVLGDVAPWASLYLLPPTVGQGESKLVQPMPPKASPWDTVQTRAVAHFVARFVALSPELKTAKISQWTLPQSLAKNWPCNSQPDRTAKLTVPVATSSRP